MLKGLVKLIVANIQILVALVANLKCPWPTALTKFTAVFAILNLDVMTVMSPCMTLSHYNKLVTAILTPPIFFACIRGGTFVAAKCGQLSDADSQNLTVKITLVLLFIVYPSTCATVLQQFLCTEINGVSYLEADYRITCHDELWAAYSAIAALGVLVYPIGVPL